MTRHLFISPLGQREFQKFFFVFVLPPIIRRDAGWCRRRCCRCRLCGGGSRPIGRCSATSGRSSSYSSGSVMSSRCVHVAPFGGQGAVGQHGQPENQQRQHEQQRLQWPPLTCRHHPPGLGHHLRRRTFVSFTFFVFSSSLIFRGFFNFFLKFGADFELARKKKFYQLTFEGVL